MATVSFEMGGMSFEYDEDKNRINLRKHGIDFRTAARVFFDYDRIEIIDEEHSYDEERFDTIGDTSAANVFTEGMTIGAAPFAPIADVLFVVYTDRIRKNQDGKLIDVTRLISARLATEFERGIYYGKY